MTAARVLNNGRLAGRTWLMEVACPGAAAAPGRFVKVRAWPPAAEGGAPLLDRPLSIHRAGGGTLSLLYRVVGRGTELLSRARAGDEVSLTGPLGRGVAEAMGRPPAGLYLAAGGIGLAPMAAVMEWAGPGRCALFYGEKSGGDQVPESWLRQWAPDAVAVTDDGTGYGGAGLVTAPLAEALGRERRPVFACGPSPMLRAVAALGEEYGVATWVSLEAFMGCGLGVCLSCSLPRAGGGRLEVCQEGPVVDSRQVAWGEA